MFNRSNLLIVVVAVVGAVLGLLVGQHFDQRADRPAPPGVTVLKLGDMRPDLSFAGLDHREHHLSEWSGKIVLLNFWAAWCNPCREEMPLLNATNEKNGIEVVGVAVDDPAAVTDYLKDNPVSYPILLGDERSNPSIVFGNTHEVFPYSVLIGKDGKVLAQKMGGFEEDSLKQWLSSNIARPD